ncbi:MAG: hypothetical protein PHO84_07325 [Dysgonamonadaceae bacterium]|nr:hypothetical protein [Dysgonamonadaceae bacterium]MDD3356162.1 hypothetical protein [Dysgonamonadaceae bacterium]MDD3728572.1 hypothetical protein [Dysgonamonadaceae bacterium]MDD4246948.1 hypothetical protein [Dysgonamonadaceae bacterium]MDD4606604.1 hypothetical protein [Dysgonamonadaceae bacterium]
MKIYAQFISSIFQPLLMPIYSVALLFIYTHFRFIYATQFFNIIIPTALFTFVVPGFLIYLMFRLNVISDLSLLKRKDRFAPYAITILCFGFLIYHFYTSGLPLWFLMMLIAPIITMAVASIITLWWKISAHMFGISSLVGGVMSICYFVEKSNPYLLFMLLFVLSGMVGVSRLILRRHTPNQVYAGFVLGFVVSFTSVWIGS